MGTLAPIVCRAEDCIGDTSRGSIVVVLLVRLASWRLFMCSVLSLSNILSKIAFLDYGFNLVLELEAFLDIVTVVTVEAAMLFLAPPYR